MLIPINNSWQSVNTLTGEPVGTAMLVQSQSSSKVFVKQQDTSPPENSEDAVVLQIYDIWQVTGGSKETWIKTAETAGQIFAEVL